MVPEEAAAPEAEAALEISPEEEKRRDERKGDADAVSDLLKEAFGAEAVQEMPKTEKLSTEKTARMEEDIHPELREFLVPSRRKTRLKEALERAAAALNRVGIPPAMLLVYALVTCLLIIFRTSPPLVLGGLGVMVLFTALGLTPLNVLGIMSILILLMELADFVRQWGRITTILGL